MPKTVPAFIDALQCIPDTDLAAVANNFRRICKKHNYNVVWLRRQKGLRFYATVVTPSKRTLFVKRFRPISIYSERAKLDILIPQAKIIGLPTIYGITDDWVIYKYIKGVYANCITHKEQLVAAVDHLLSIHKMPTGFRFVQHPFFRTKVATISWGPFVRQIPEIAKTIRRYGAPEIASEQLLMLLDRIKPEKQRDGWYEAGYGWVFNFPTARVDALKRYDFVLCHGGYIPKHLYHTRWGFRVIDWETATLFSRWYDVWRLGAFVSENLTDILWSRYIHRYLAC